jgi:hypothetical protein
VNKRQRAKRRKRQEARLAEYLRGLNVMRKLGEIGAAIRAEFGQSSIGAVLFSPKTARHVGQWMDGLGIVHAVNALSAGPDGDIDTGLETACEATFWNPDEPWLYPNTNSFELEVDCMACVAGAGPG